MSGRARTDRRDHNELLDEQAFVSRSLEDLDREHAAGDLDTADYETLRGGYEAQSRALTAALSQALAPSALPARSTSRDTTSSTGLRAWLSNRRHRLVLGWSATACFAVAAAVLALAVAGVTPFATQPPLSVATQIRIELGEASTLAAHQQIARAVTVYDKVLGLDPEQPEALADGGWLLRLAGLSSKHPSLVAAGDTEIAAAVQVAPGYALARAYDAVALYEDDHAAGSAVRELQALLADHPTPTLLKSVRTPAEAAYHAVSMAVPAAIASAT
jgi:hypothetical protein